LHILSSEFSFTAAVIVNTFVFIIVFTRVVKKFGTVRFPIVLGMIVFFGRTLSGSVGVIGTCVGFKFVTDIFDTVSFTALVPVNNFVGFRGRFTSCNAFHHQKNKNGLYEYSVLDHFPPCHSETKFHYLFER